MWRLVVKTFDLLNDAALLVWLTGINYSHFTLSVVQLINNVIKGGLVGEEAVYT